MDSQHANWRAVWNRRGFRDEGGLDLDALIQLDGFDVGAGLVTAEDWCAHAALVVRRLGVETGHSVFEFGCGAGAFLKAISACVEVSVGGVDYSEPLLHTARRALPRGDFRLGDAADFCGRRDCDFTLAHAVLHYFDLRHAEAVVARMVEKSRVAACILDVPDADLREQSEQVRREKLTVEEYERRYAGLPHTYYSRSWFRDLAQKLEVDCEVFDGQMSGYAQRAFRFGVILRKRAEETPSRRGV